MDSLDKIVSLCKRRGFIYPGSEIYGGLANSWDYGPLGVELKNNIKSLWWRRFVHERDDMVGLDAALIMNSKVWESSGHLSNFNDPLVECESCHNRFREEDVSQITNYQLPITKQIPNPKSQKGKCSGCGGELTQPRVFNLMFKTFLGPSEDTASTVYLRPETAQAMFVDFKNVLDTSRPTIPFGIAQIGRAFRNEITPGNFIFRTREFEMMEIEYFVRPPGAASRTNADKRGLDAEKEEWEKYFEHWRGEMLKWLEDIGVDLKHIHELEVPAEERAHYSKRTIDFEYDFPFGRKELYGLAYRADFDLKNHFNEPPYRDAETGQEFWPHVIEPSWGVDRSVLAVLCSAYDDTDPERIVLKLKPQLAPYKVAVFPLVANKPQLVEKARVIYKSLQAPSSKFQVPVVFDDRGNIGKRYYAQDEIGTPFCVTVDYQTLEDDTVTVRDRDTAKQERVGVSALNGYLGDKISNS
ncbi:MAG: glycine--tRNA ligase [Parcubacteria group bacterium]|nr:glycine--tRNA ligase [Parcubacteria group bacterium]